MASRYTETDKWDDAWFANLTPLEKLLFSYLCDNCNIAGIIEIIIPKWTTALRGKGTLTQEDTERALKGLQRGFIYSKEKDCLYLRTFLKHQKNLPLNPNNPAHRGILAKFEAYAHKFDIEDIKDFIEGASKGLQSPICNGNGNSNGNKGGVGGKTIKEREQDFTQSLQSFDYPKEMAAAFARYWTEPNKSGIKMRFELEKTWDMGRRLVTWSSRDTSFQKKERIYKDGDNITSGL
jgi:hypothetical protein